MARLDNLSDQAGAGNHREAEEILRTVTQDLRSLQQELIAQLNQDIKRLQAERSRLLNDVEKVRDQLQHLQEQQQVVLSRQQLAQQQIWAKRLAQVLANHLQASLTERVNQLSGPYPPHHPSGLSASPEANGHTQSANDLLASLDATLNRTVSTMRQELNSYQSSLSQQLGRMQSMEQQGEAILELLVSRLSQQLQLEAEHAQAAYPLQTEAYNSQTHPAVNGGTSTVTGSNSYRRDPSPSPHLNRGNSSPRPAAPTVIPVAPAIAPEAAVAPSSGPFRRQLSQFQRGLLLILFSTVALSLHNVVVSIVGTERLVLGAFPLGGFISLNSLGSSLLILWMRMLVVVPAMALLGWQLYKPVWRDIRVFSTSKDRSLLRTVIGSGLFLFISQVLIYIAIGQIGPGVAVTILFMYPLITVPLAWLLFGDRPSQLRIGVMFAILTGVILTAFPRLTATTNVSWLGIGTAVLSGVAFACYLIAMQISFRRLHPIPVSMLQFVTIFVLASVSLIILGVDVAPTNLPGLMGGGLVLGVLTLVGYLLNNFGVRAMGAARASIIASSGPVLTALLAFLIIPGPNTALQIVQWLGILVVTTGVVALSFERMAIQNRVARAEAKG